MPTTPILQLRYPAGGDPNNVPADIQNLAADVEGTFTGQGLIGARPAAGRRGRIYEVLDGGGAHVKLTYDDGVAWQDFAGGDAAFRAYTESLVTNAATTGAVSLNQALATVFNNTLTGNTTFTFDNPVGAGRVSSFTLLLTQDGTGGRTVTWPATVKWPGGAAPGLSTGANKKDMLTFLTIDGGATYLGALVASDVR